MYREYYKKIGDLWKDILEGKKLDPVGSEDKDIDNDGDHDKSDKYLHNRRKAIKADMKKEEVEQVDEITKSTYVNALRKKGDPEETRGDSGTERRILNRAEREHGPDFAKKLLGVGKRDERPITRPDPLASRKKSRVTASGKANKQDISTLKSTIKGDMKKEAVDLNTKAVDKALTHDCAKHVTSETWGRGECIPGQHTIVEDQDGQGFVTHYDVMFEHGVEFDVPVSELTVLVSESHKHTAKKMKNEEASASFKKHYKSGTKPEKFGDINSEGEKKFAAQHDFGKAELVYDDEKGHEDATKFGRITKKAKPAPGNQDVGHKNFGD
jgi:hypothetical protein